MAYVDASTTLRIGGKCKDSDYNTTAYANLTVSSSGSTINWKVSMETTNYPFVYLYLKIGSKVLYDGYYANKPSNYDQKKGFIQTASNVFPRGNGTSASDSFTDNSTGTSLAIVLKVGPSYWPDSDKSDDYNNTYRIYSSGSSVTLSRRYYTSVSAPTVTITDNYDNSFTIKATKGASGTNNTAKALTDLLWSYTNSTSGRSKYTSGTKIDLTTSGTADTRTVYAWATTTATYGDDKTKKESAAINQYLAPSAPGKPVISYTKNRLTIKENWTFTWAAATKANSTSPLKGYRIRLYKNGVTIPILNSAGKVLTATGTDKYYDRNGTTRTLTIDPVAHGFLPGDQVKLKVHAYTRYGSDNSGAQLFGTSATSATSTVQNAGVIHVKVGNEWKEGQVFVKVNGGWKEAETVSTKVGNNWKESV